MSNKELEDSLAKLLELKEKYKMDCDALEMELVLKKQKEEDERKAVIDAEYADKLAAVFADRIKPLLLEVLKS